MKMYRIYIISRWEVIDVVRTLSTEKVKAGEEGSDSFKFSRFVSLFCASAFSIVSVVTGGTGSR